MLYRPFRYVLSFFRNDRDQDNGEDDWGRLARWDVAYDEQLTVFHSEKLQNNEKGEVVGMTAIFRDGTLNEPMKRPPPGYGDRLGLKC